MDDLQRWDSVDEAETSAGVEGRYSPAAGGGPRHMLNAGPSTSNPLVRLAIG
jgi:hypothetical protein